MSDDELFFVCMADLLSKDKSVKDLATAIEAGGIYGWDEFGRFRHFVSTPTVPCEHVRKALRVLAGHYQRLNDPFHQWSPSDEDPEGNPLYQFGWPATRLPKWPVANSSPELVTGSKNSGDSGTINIIAVLLDIIAGRSGWAPHPQWQSEAALIDCIVQRYGDFRGLSERNLQAKFAAGKRQLAASNR